MIRTENRLRICNAAIACMLIFIWGNSAMPAEISQTFSDSVKELLSELLSSSGSGQGSGLIRKIAHFTEFTALGVLLCWRAGMRNKKKYVPFLWGAAAACIDECIQFFAPGRAPRVTDVLLDSCGVLTGVLLLSLGHTVFKKNNT